MRPYSPAPARWEPEGRLPIFDRTPRGTGGGMRLRTSGLMAGVAMLLVAAGCEKREARERETASAPMHSEPGTTSKRRPTPPPPAAPPPREAPPPRAEVQRPSEPPAPQQPDDATASPTQPRQVSGEVLAVTGNQLHVLSATEGQDVRMLIISGTEVLVDGRPATAAEIREGSEVRATYEIAEGEPIALLVEVRNPGSAREPEEQPLLNQPRIPKSDD
jgi:type IV secretory pathway VirB10-like protein